MNRDRLFPREEIVAFGVTILERSGVPTDSALLVAQTLVLADLKGIGSHGMMRLPAYVKRIQTGTIDILAIPEILNETTGTLSMDGKKGLGQVVAVRAMRSVIGKARSTGVGVATVRGGNHFGCASYYAELAVDAGMIGIVACNASPVMPPTGGNVPLLGNNPIAIGAPAGKFGRLVLDISTSMAAAGKVVLAKKLGQKIPLDWALGPDGKPTDDPEVALKRLTLLPMAGHKGYGLALMLDLLSGILAGAEHGRGVRSFFREYDQDYNAGFFLLALNIGAFIPLNIFTTALEAYIEEIKTSSRIDPSIPIWVPGEIENHLLTERARLGIPYPSEVVAELNQLARSLSAPELR
jgi:ureidoglycolate dehydrogenase (NAD+)